MAYKRKSPIPVVEGGTGAQTLTGVLIGNGTSAVGVSTVTQYGTVVAGASNTVSSVAPSSTAGVPLVSGGSSANPSYTTAVVAGGGTGQVSFTANAPIIAGSSSTAALAQVTTNLNTAGYVLTANGSGAPTFQAAASGNLTITNVTYATGNPYVVLSTDQFITADVTGGVITINLPNAPTTGRVISIKDEVGLAGTNNITITTVGGSVDIDGSTSFVMNTAYQAVSVIFDGSNYYIY